MKWLSDTFSRILSTIFAGAVLVAVAYPITPGARLAALEHGLHPIKPIQIMADGGGSVSQAEEWYERVRESGVPVELVGECDSACTLVLLLPASQVCVKAGATLGFHLASTFHDGKYQPDPEYTKKAIRQYYPKVVQDWLAKQPPLTVDITAMDADTIVDLGIFPRCPSR